MIKVECNEGTINVGITGTGLKIMSELCVIVDRVCGAMAEDVDFSKEDKYLMMITVANAIKRKAKEGIENDSEDND